MATPTRVIILSLLGLSFATACASPGPSSRAGASVRNRRMAVARAAEVQVGVPYRYGGSSPRGFDCSGLVVYSYRQAGFEDLPHSATALDAVSQRISLGEIEPGDLLFFRLDGPKTTHVGIYVGGRQFVHAPSSGKRVEKVSFDHVYWGEKISRAGRVVW
jgi:murein DD-endopeptidase